MTKIKLLCLGPLAEQEFVSVYILPWLSQKDDVLIVQTYFESLDWNLGLEGV